VTDYLMVVSNNKSNAFVDDAKRVCHDVDVYMNGINRKGKNERKAQHVIKRRDTGKAGAGEGRFDAKAIGVHLLLGQMRQADANPDASCASVSSASCQLGPALSRSKEHHHLLERRKTITTIVLSQSSPNST